MTQTIDIYGGSYFQAASLKAVFNTRVRKPTEPAEVAAILHDAVELLGSISMPLSIGFKLIKREPMPYVGYRPQTLLSLQDAPTIATAAQPGDGLGMVGVAASDTTCLQLQSICRTFKLASTAEAARLAIGVYAAVQNVSPQYGQVYLERGTDKLSLNPSP